MTLMRICTICGQVDDHPRHVHAAPNTPTPADVAERALENCPAEHLGAILAQIRDDTVAMAHMDCCADAGCPDGSCDEIRATIPAGSRLKGDRLRKHLTSGNVDHIGPMLNDARVTAETPEGDQS